MLELVVFLGVLLGCLARSVMPFLRKVRDAAEAGRAITWDHRYTISLAASLLLASAAALILLPTVQVPWPTSLPIAFSLAFTVGFGSNGIINELLKQAGVV